MFGCKSTTIYMMYLILKELLGGRGKIASQRTRNSVDRLCLLEIAA